MDPSPETPIKSFDDLAGIAAEFDDGCRIVENSFDTRDEEWLLSFSNGYRLCMHAGGTFKIHHV